MTMTSVPNDEMADASDTGALFAVRSSHAPGMSPRWWTQTSRLTTAHDPTETHYWMNRSIQCHLMRIPAAGYSLCPSVSPSPRI